MIRFNLFDFAAPPLTAIQWFNSTVINKGVIFEGSQNASALFPENDDSRKFRVSLVSNPCAWLSSFYVSAKKVASPAVYPFIRFRLDCIDQFIQDYLQIIPGGVGDLFSMYKADSCLRVEDLPWALDELLTTLEVPHDNLYKPVPQQVNLIPRQLHAKVIEAERDFCERYDYW